MKTKLTATRDLTLTGAKSIAAVAQKYAAEIRILCRDKGANAKSLMGVIALSYKKGETLYLVAEGKDAARASEEIGKYL